MLLQHGAWLDDGTATHPLAGRSLYNITMATSKQGGVFGFIRGKVGSVSYSVLSSKTSSSGKREQVVRSLPQSVSNPQTMGQVMQRMKLAPAQKFYAAFADLLSNAFEGVAYGEASRRYFISKAMSATGPYIEKGVDRFIPAQYVFSEGTLPSVGIEAFSGGSSVITLSATTTVAADAITPDIFAAALNVSADTQITIVVVNNVNGVFTPSYIGYDQRVKIENLPASIFGKDADNHLTLNPAAVNLDASAIVACCVVLSKQDASGNWLRSTQTMVISNELIASLYGSEALQRATVSYQNGQTSNAINSEWYYNLGMSQAFNGTVHVGAVNSIAAENNGRPYLVLMGDQQIDGVVITTLFTVDGTASTQLIGVYGSEAVLQTLANGDPCIPETNVANYTNYRYAQYNPTIANQAGYYDGTEAEPVKEPFLMSVAHWDETEEKYVCVEEEFVSIERANSASDAPFAAVKADGTKVYLICVNTASWGWNCPVIKKTTSMDDDPKNAFGNHPSLLQATHVLDNDDTNFIPFSYNDETTGHINEESMANWAVMQTKGFNNTIFLYH